ncbi:DUF1405 domain-containing protein [Halorarum halobium]|uniref:DUF1405 domain-containing protein n=1 Tax=Halorarum halobium TaxID=3075121 RepID=UPI0028A7A273|nr:DUF1405 domain-containing protein [Halobaculum sp. XH14]
MPPEESSDGERSRGPIPRKLAEFYLTTPWTVVLLLVANAFAFLIGVRYYVETMTPVPTYAWPLYGDSPTAIALGTLVLAAVVPFAGRRLVDVPRNYLLDGLVTLAVVWLLKMGLWTFLALNVPLVRPDLPVDLYVGFGPDSLWAYWGILLTHFAFLLWAGVLAHVGRTSRRTLAAALVLALVNDVFDYGFLLGLPLSNYPPVRYEPGWLLAAATVGISFLSVAVAARLLPRVEP